MTSQYQKHLGWRVKKFLNFFFLRKNIWPVEGGPKIFPRLGEGVRNFFRIFQNILHAPLVDTFWPLPYVLTLAQRPNISNRRAGVKRADKIFNKYLTPKPSNSIQFNNIKSILSNPKMKSYYFQSYKFHSENVHFITISQAKEL